MGGRASRRVGWSELRLGLWTALVFWLVGGALSPDGRERKDFLRLAAQLARRYDMLIDDAPPNLPSALPLTLAAMWDLLRASITASQNMLDAILLSDRANWTNWLFLYLAVCLTVRMTPFEGNRRGAVVAILLSGLVIGLLASFIPPVERAVLSSWEVLSFAVGMLVFLLLVSLLVSGVVGLVRILARNE